MAITEEELKNMSPEEIAELQKQQCVFCHIVAGKVASKKIYADNDCLAILDINPANPGHVLLLTKEHYQIMPQVPGEIIAHMFMVVKHLSQSTLRALNVPGVNVLIANGIAAGQKAPHFMIHIIPRTEGDGLKFIVPQKKVSENDLETLRKNVKPRVNKIFGLKEEEPIDINVQPERIKAKIVEAEFEEEKEEKQPEPKQETKEKKLMPKKDVEKNQKNIDLNKIAELFSK